MKYEEQVRENMIQKVAIWASGMHSEKLKEHIRMLDWVLSPVDETIRDIDEIIEEYVDVEK